MQATQEAQVYGLTDSERNWLKGLQDDLWPPDKPDRFSVKLLAHRSLTALELRRIQDLITSRGLLTAFICTSMFGGYGMDIYEHEPSPGAGPLFLLRLTEDNLPDPHPLAVAEGEVQAKEKRPGEGRDDAWEIFSKFTHAKKNVAWLRGYKMELPRSRGHYDY